MILDLNSTVQPETTSTLICESRYVRLAHEKKNYGFTPNLDFNPLSTRFNFCLQACIQRVFSTLREKRTGKNGISIALKLVSIEYQRRVAFWKLCRGKQTNISEQCTLTVY